MREAMEGIRPIKPRLCIRIPAAGQNAEKRLIVVHPARIRVLGIADIATRQNLPTGTPMADCAVMIARRARRVDNSMATMFADARAPEDHLELGSMPYLKPCLQVTLSEIGPVGGLKTASLPA